MFILCCADYITTVYLYHVQPWVMLTTSHYYPDPCQNSLMFHIKL